jgi:hypothetical protein
MQRLELQNRRELLHAAQLLANDVSGNLRGQSKRESH